MGWFYSITEKGILLESLLRTVSNIKVIFSSKKRSIFSYSEWRTNQNSKLKKYTRTTRITQLKPKIIN